MRNLCEGSEQARAAIAELRACAAVDSDELRAAGLRVTLDERSGKMKVERREGGAAPPGDALAAEDQEEQFRLVAD